MRVLLVGGTGFVGGHLQRYLNNHEYSVAVYDDSIDIRHAEKVKHAIASDRPDAVIHLAAQSAVPESFRNPQEHSTLTLKARLICLWRFRMLVFPVACCI